MVDCRLLSSSRDCYCIQLPRKPLQLHKKQAKSLNTLILLHKYLQLMSSYPSLAQGQGCHMLAEIRVFFVCFCIWQQILQSWELACVSLSH